MVPFFPRLVCRFFLTLGPAGIVRPAPAEDSHPDYHQEQANKANFAHGPISSPICPVCHGALSLRERSSTNCPAGRRVDAPVVKKETTSWLSPTLAMQESWGD